MKIYQTEILDGLEKAIASKASARCEFGLLSTGNKTKASRNITQSDLFFIDDAILVSTNWNLNDDIFTKSEVWKARYTPIDKQFNHMHDDSFIIGHITEARTVDFDGNIILDNTPVESLPDFDISISSVIYKNFQNEAKAKIVETLIQEIPENKWCVSMECIFSGFDYGVITPEGNQAMITRSEESSFLTKHLRAYGGTGIFQGYKIGRLLTGINFSGVGSVDRPGNPRSIIKSFSFNGAKASVQVFSEKKMTKENEEMKSGAVALDVVSKAQYDELKQELVSAKALASKASEKEMEDAKKAKCELETSLASVQKELDATKALSEQRAEKIKALEAEVAAEKEAVKAAKDKAEKMEEEKKTQSRVNELVSAGVQSARANELVNKFSSASDEMFAEVVALNTKAKTEDDMKDKEDKTKASDLNKIVEEKTIAQNNQDLDVAKAASNWFGSLLKTSSKESK